MSLTNPSSLTTVAQLNTVAQDITTKADNRFMKKGEGATYTVKKQSSAESGYVATYQLFSVGTGTGGADEAAGEKINIPKDYLVTAVTETPLTVTAADKAAGGIFENNDDFQVGDKYIRFTVNVKDGAAETPTYMYINLNSLVDTYTGGDGIAIDNSNVVSIDLDTTNANGLEIDSTSKKLKMGTASSSTTGALTSTDWNTFNGKQNALSAGTAIDATAFGNGTLNVVAAQPSTSGTGGNAGTMSAADKEKLDNADVTAYTGTGAVSVSDHEISVAAASPSTSGVGGAAGTMSAADKEKLDGFTFATTADITEITDGIWPSA